jgi:hypothetical protein
MSSYIAYLEQVGEHIKINFPLHLEAFNVFLNTEKEWSEYRRDDEPKEERDIIKNEKDVVNVIENDVIIKNEHNDIIKDEHHDIKDEHKVLKPLKKLKFVEPKIETTHVEIKPKEVVIPQTEIKELHLPTKLKFKPVIKSLPLEQHINNSVLIVP